METNPILGELARGYRGNVCIEQEELESRGVRNAKEKRLARDLAETRRCERRVHSHSRSRVIWEYQRSFARREKLFSTGFIGIDGS